ncbi:cytochrome C [Bacteriovorax sp. BSW11_IV]|uniref:c-type cytochrome n=1 Tax=Bacteriovorax sp. BSW11_IV TaxID=1353529 RepID=UPI00038A4DB3|nr:c-type cytochrome [Bacteriovorax sp. BSW11_IV]EQC47023.1 cytochrome C [Bacteriovorax sp. BSW11_IV]
MSKKNEPGMAFNMDKLNKVFAFFSVALLITVVWVFLDDYIRPWKAIQVEAMKIKKSKLAGQVAEEEKTIDKDKVADLEKKIEEAKANVASKKETIDQITDELEQILKHIKEETIINGRLNSQVAALTFKWENAHSHHKANAGDLFKKLREEKRLFAESKDRMKALQAQEKTKNKAIAAEKSDLTTLEKELTGITMKLDLLQKAESKLALNPLFALRNAPFVDFLDPTVKIHQIVLENITDDRYFQHVPKVDRCITCHTFIDQEGYEDQPNPHKTHPKLDMMVGANSTHPMKKFGCTTCHGGEGHRVTNFNSAAHIPQNEEQKAEWIQKYHWHAPHKVPIEMFKKQHSEAGCVKCHTETQYLPGATALNEGRRNIEKFGCYACHKIEGWEHKRKPGPSLEKIAAKVDKEFFKNWVWDPKSFNKHAKMPSFFMQMNNTKKDEFIKKNIAEVNAIAEFIYDKSKPYKPFMKYSGGNSEKGKELVKSVGCMACHGVDDFAPESKKVNAHAGPFLTGIGSKVDADWLVSWLKKPSHYQEDTIMPSFRLTDREANDITAYLMSMKNKKFESLKFEDMSKELRDELLVEYFSAFDTEEVAKKKLASMSDRERTLELGYRSVGKYGCYSCHSIEGFDGRAPIGPELTKVGSKPLTQFGFSHEYDVEKSRDGWIKAHLINPRRWDNGVDKPFKDLLRMPNFDMSEKEAETITTALLGQVADKVPLSGVKRLDAREAVVAEGMKVVQKFNCVGCHQIDGMFGDIVNMYPDDINEAPPRLVGEGHRVQADWFHFFLNNVYKIRPWLNVRMPSFVLSNDERNKIVAMFQAKAGQETFEENYETVKWLPGEREGAVKLFKSLDCASCHTTGFNKEDPTAPNLHFAKRRLRASWIKKWLHDPQKILPGTVMPSFWENGESTDTEVFGGDAEKQINALTKYLLEIGEDKYSPETKK